jgi:transposase
VSSSRLRSSSDAQWEKIEPLLPSDAGRRGHRSVTTGRVVEGIVYRYRTGIPWRDLPREEFGSWRTV